MSTSTIFDDLHEAIIWRYGVCSFQARQAADVLSSADDTIPDAEAVLYLTTILHTGTMWRSVAATNDPAADPPA